MSFPRPPFSRRTDLAAITADDELLDALGAGMPAALCPTGASGAAYDGSAELTRLLAGWVNDLDAAPAGGQPMPARSARVGRHSFEYFAAQAIPLPSRADHDSFPFTVRRADAQASADTLAVALEDDIEPVDPRSLRRARRIAAASAVAATVGLFGLIQVEQATPGSVWWPLVEVLDSDRADSVAAQTAVTESLDVAQRLVQEGRLTEASQALEQAKDKLELVLPEDGYSDLADQVDQVQAELSDDPTLDGAGAAGAPAAPPSNAGTDVPSSADPSGEAAGSADNADAQIGMPPVSGAASTEAPAWPGFNWNLSLSMLLPAEESEEGDGAAEPVDPATTPSESGEGGQSGDQSAPPEESAAATTDPATGESTDPAASSSSESGAPTSQGTPSGSLSGDIGSGTPATLVSAGPSSSGTPNSARAM